MREPTPHHSTQTSNAGGSGGISQKGSTPAQAHSLCHSNGAMTQGWIETSSFPLSSHLLPSAAQFPEPLAPFPGVGAGCPSGVFPTR